SSQLAGESGYRDPGCSQRLYLFPELRRNRTPGRSQCRGTRLKGLAENRVPVITIDGPSGSGKGTVSRRVAARLGWHLLDSGALYRLVAYAGRERTIPFSDEAAFSAIARDLDVSF